VITFIFIVVGIGVLFCLYVMVKPKTFEQKEYERKLKESLADESIVDSATGTKITIEEAESGHWISHDNEFRTVSDSDLDKLLSEGEKQVEIALNYLRESREYRKILLTEEQLDMFVQTKTLSSYDDWTYSNPYSFESGILILPTPELNGVPYYENDYVETHLMFWKKIENINGHYYLREKSSIEKIFDRFRKDDDLHLKNYESFTFNKSFDLIRINRLLENFENKKGLQIEIKDENLFVKTTKLVSIEDIKRIENILKDAR